MRCSMYLLVLVVLSVNADDGDGDGVKPQTCTNDDDCAEKFSCIGEDVPAFLEDLLGVSSEKICSPTCSSDADCENPLLPRCMTMETDSITGWIFGGGATNKECTSAGPLDCGATEDCNAGYKCLEQRKPVPPPRPAADSAGGLDNFFDNIFGGGGGGGGRFGNLDETLGGLFSDDLMPLQCTKTCTSDAECTRGTCEKENGGESVDSFFADLFGAEEVIKLCIPTCTETSECRVGEWCIQREQDVFFGGFFGGGGGGGRGGGGGGGGGGGTKDCNTFGEPDTHCLNDGNHNDQVGMVCHNDGRPNEMKCFYDEQKRFVCGTLACTADGNGGASYNNDDGGDGGDGGVVVAECVPDAFECIDFNDGAGCASGTECGPILNNQLAHRACMLSDAGQEDPGTCYQCHDPVCYNKYCGAECTPLALAAAGTSSEGYMCDADNECVDTTQDGALTCPPRTTTTLNPEWIGKPGATCDDDTQCGGENLKCLEQEGQLFGPFAGLFAVARVCTATCEVDSDCDRGSCTEEDGLSGMLSGLLGHAQLCVATCEVEDDCYVGEDCIVRESDAIFGGLFGSPTKECVPGVLECDAFNNGAGCATTESCLPKNEEQRAHLRCLKTADTTDCFACKDPGAGSPSSSSPGRGDDSGMPPWMAGVWDGVGGWLDGDGSNIFDAFGGVKMTTTRAPLCAGCNGQAGSWQASSGKNGGGGGDGASTATKGTTIAIAVSVCVVLVVIVIAVAVMSKKNRSGGGGGGGGVGGGVGGGADAESFTNPGYGQFQGNGASAYANEENTAADSGASNTGGYMDIPAPRGLDNPQYMEVAPHGDFSASSA